MAVTISLYDHTAKRFADGSNGVEDTYRLLLCTAATFDATDAALASIAKTESPTGTGYPAGGPALSGVAVSISDTNGAAFSADNVTLSAEGGSIEAEFAVLYNESNEDNAPVAFINFGEPQAAPDGTDFLIIWSENGIIKWSPLD